MLVGLLVALGTTGCGGGTLDDPRALETTVTTNSPESPQGSDGPGSTVGASASPPAQPSEVTVAPAVLTQEDDGARVVLAAGAEVPLRLDSAWTWNEPRIDGDAVVLTPVDYFDDPGFVEWLVTGAAAGTATLRADGEPACDDTTACPARRLTIEVVVGG